MSILSRTLCTLLLLLPLPGWSTEVPLFVIQRSKNANEVQYHLRVDAQCRLRAPFPVSAIWHLRAAQPVTTAPLSALDQLAYGVARQRVDEQEVVFRLRALEEKPIKATVTAHPETGTCLSRVYIQIHAQWAALERVYVQTEEGRVRPTVTYIDLVGTTVEDPPRPVTERITP
jgi:hypothetical protein